MRFKQFIENLWGNIPVVGRKPSDGVQGQSDSSPGKGGATGGGSMGGSIGGSVLPPEQPRKMMRKKMRKES